MFSRIGLKLRRGYFPNTCYKKNDIPSVHMNFSLGGKEFPIKIKVEKAHPAL
jgi:hypothetical protein